MKLVDRRIRPWIAIATTVLLVALLASCSTARYVSQSLTGGARVLLARQPIERLIAEPDTPADLRTRLELILAMREFARDQLQLPVGKSYSSFVELDRPYVAWNVVAAPALSVEPETWCFPIAGCVSYRGYFSERRAERFADRLRRQGLDVSVGGVTAYSTLGWFADPVLDTFVGLPEVQLAGLLFHELAHRRLYVPGDTAFNESFASFVGTLGEEQWAAERAAAEQWAEAQASARREDQFLDLMLGARACLERLYASSAAPEMIERGKAQEFALLEQRYQEVRLEWEQAGVIIPFYDAWFAGALNNSHVAAVGDYSIWIESFARLHELSTSLEDFYARASALGELEVEERARQLEALGPRRRFSERSCASTGLDGVVR